MTLWAENGDVSQLAAIDDVRIDCVAPDVKATDDAEALSGTSMATPFVAGAAALIWGRAPNAGPREVRRALLGSCTPVAALRDNVGCNGRLDVNAAAQLALPDAPRPEPPEPEQPLPELPLIEGARPGDFDPTFGQGGLATIDLRANADEEGPMPLAVWPDADGGVTTTAESGGGEWVLSRVRQDGTPDSSFGTEGRMRVSVPLDTTPYAGAHYNTYSAARDADGRILLGSVRDYPTGLDPMVIQRRLPDGSADTSFGDGGHVLVPLPSRAITELPLALDADGGVVAAQNTEEGVRVVQLRADGSRDPAFGDNGVAAVALDSYVSVHQVRRDAHGRILIAGRALHRGDYVCAVARLTADGTLDTSFGEDGVDWTGIPVAPGEIQLAVTPDSRLLVALGTPAYVDEPQIVVARRLPDGGPDPSFGHDGNTVAEVERGTEHLPTDMAALPDGRVLVAASWRDWTPFRTSSGGLLRFRRDGSLDQGWADHGVMALATEVASRYLAVHALNVDAHGRAVTAGVNAGGELGLSRTLGGRLADETPGDPDPDPSPTATPTASRTPTPTTTPPASAPPRATFPVPGPPAPPRRVPIARRHPRRPPAWVQIRSLATRGNALIRRVTLRVPAHARLIATCRGKGCPFKRRAYRPRNHSRTLQILPLRRARLHPGTRLTFVMRPRHGNTKVARYRVTRAGRLRKQP
jgi:uncharacterized delta-60 repeat protein